MRTKDLLSCLLHRALITPTGRWTPSIVCFGSLWEIAVQLYFHTFTLTIWIVTGPHATGMVDSLTYHVGDTFTVIVVRTVVIIKTVTVVWRKMRLLLAFTVSI